MTNDEFREEDSRIDVHLHVDAVTINVSHTVSADDVLKTMFKSIIDQGVKIMASQADLATALSGLNDSMTAIGVEVDKVGTETQTLQAQVATLTAALAGGTTTPAVDAALAAVKATSDSLAAKVQAVDALVPDAPVSP